MRYEIRDFGAHAKDVVSGTAPEGPGEASTIPAPSSTLPHHTYMCHCLLEPSSAPVPVPHASAAGAVKYSTIAIRSRP